MPTYIASAGEDFIVQRLDRTFRGGYEEVLKIDGATGIVTVAGQTISSSGVIGSVGAVTATTIDASGAITGATTLDITGLATLGDADVTDDLNVGDDLDVGGAATFGGTVSIVGKTVATGGIHSVVTPGRNLAGDIAIAGTVLGDEVVAMFNHTDGTNDVAKFESTITVSGHLQQSAAEDLSTKTYLVLLHRP